MSDLAAFSGTYADWKLIKTRSVVQVVFEIPVENSNAVLQVLGGMPDGTRWFGIAPLAAGKETPDVARRLEAATPQPSTQPRQAGAKRDWRELAPAAQAALRCGDAIFRAFLLEECGFDTKDADQAAVVVRQLCKVESRTEFNSDPQANLRWVALDGQFEAWKALEHA